MTKEVKVRKPAPTRGAKPGERRGGRKAGTPNKISLTVKQAVLDAFKALGGVKHMTRWGKANPTEFYKIAARLIPQEVTGQDGGPIVTSVTINLK